MITQSPPKLTLVVHNDDSVLQGRQAFANLTWASRALAANLTALGSGSGCANELIHQIRDLACAIDDAEALTSLERVSAQLADSLLSQGTGSGAIARA